MANLGSSREKWTEKGVGKGEKRDRKVWNGRYILLKERYKVEEQAKKTEGGRIRFCDKLGEL